jgi:hypothetical protein
MFNHIWDLFTISGLFDIRGREGDRDGSPTGKGRVVISHRNAVGMGMSFQMELSSFILV